MVNPKVDELSMMTYVSYFPEAKLKPGAPLRPRVHPASKCYAKGPGIEPRGLVVKKPADFTVFTQGAGRGRLGVSVIGPGKVEQEVSVKDNEDHTYSCQYVPQKPGELFKESLKLSITKIIFSYHIIKSSTVQIFVLRFLTQFPSVMQPPITD